MKVGDRYSFQLENGGIIEGTVLYKDNIDERGDEVVHSSLKNIAFDDVKIRKDIAPSLKDSNNEPEFAFHYKNIHEQPGIHGLYRAGPYFIKWGDEKMDLMPGTTPRLIKHDKGWRIGGKSRRQKRKRSRRRRSSRR
jgi:hypothetical protein